MPAGAVVEILDPDPALVFPEGPSTAIKSLGPLESMVVQIPVTVDEALVDWQKTPITVRLSTPGGCVETQDRLLMTVLNGDVEVEASRFDDVETPVVAWTIGGTNSESIWGRSFDVDGYFWHGNDVGTTSDTWLATPALQVSDVDPLVVTLEHAYSFEYSDNTFWDGGLIEFTVDDGATWTDVATLIDPGYGGAINSMVNPLNGREAFVDKNPGYPDRETLVLDFGTQLAGQTAKLRFRIGTDAAAGGPGWDIDDIDIDGVKNTPFAQWIPDQTVCEQAGETTTTGDESTSTSDTSTGDDTSTASTSSTSTGDDTTAASTGDDSSSGGESTTNALTSGSTSEGSTSFPVTTGEPATTAVDSDSGGQESGPDPTTGGGGPGTVSAGEESSGGGSSSGEDPGETVDDGGCGCAAGEPTPWALQVLPWLGLLGLRRRRSR
jgi:MYXO-CTERM domain-containing protein